MVVKKTICSGKIEISQLIVENEVLKAFASTTCEFLPRLYNAQWKVSKEFPYIVSQPKGIPLLYFMKSLSSKERKSTMTTLYQNLLNGLEAALEVGFCHTDLRPDNVVVVREIFVIIDWGLATRQHTRFHKYRAGIDFYHDEIVCNSVDALLFKTEFDKFSAKCIAYYFAERRTPWTKIREAQGDADTGFIVERHRCLSRYFE